MTVSVGLLTTQKFSSKKHHDFPTTLLHGYSFSVFIYLFFRFLFFCLRYKMPNLYVKSLCVSVVTVTLFEQTTLEIW